MLFRLELLPAFHLIRPIIYLRGMWHYFSTENMLGGVNCDKHKEETRG